MIHAFEQLMMPLRTRSGRIAAIVSIDMRLPYPLLVLIGNDKTLKSYRLDGTCFDPGKDDSDRNELRVAHPVGWAGQSVTAEKYEYEYRRGINEPRLPQKLFPNHK